MKSLILLIFAFNSHASLQKIGGQGRALSWSQQNITYEFNTNGCQQDIKSEFLSISQESAYQWSSNSSLNLSIRSTSNGPSSYRNDIYCSSDLSYMESSAVVGVTRVIYNKDNGQIIETDIILSNNITFSLQASKTNYVGNVLTHELGHSVGFDHSEAFRSTMFYSLFLGQHTLSFDDKAGAYSIYPEGGARGIIIGKVIGGTVDEPIGIFGAYVQAYSTQTGELMGSVVTRDDGTFQIRGLAKDDQYFLYVTPLDKLDTISKYFSSARTEFCGVNFAGNPYRGSFFTTCDTTSGYPQGINLENGIVDVGSISAYCELREIKLQREDIPAVNSRSIASFVDFELHGYATDIDFGSTFVSYFTPNELSLSGEASSTVIQEFDVDLSSEEIFGDNDYLDIKLTSQNFYSQIQLEMKILNTVTGASETFSSEYQDSEGNIQIKINDDGAPELNLIGRALLDAIDSSNNIFKVLISAVKVDFSKYTSFSENDFFPDNKNFIDEIGFYLGVISISDGDNKTVMQKDYGGIRDNLSCPGAPYALPVAAIVDPASNQDEDDGFFSCNSIEPKNGGGKGPFNLGLGFLLALLVSRVGHDSLKKRKTHGGD
ncbi:MAG: hypothetical protein DRQ88_02815 [Epsilonproteobacteria bacterium]|nr:MAG: hypothetical protein DRQ89_01770 [Campylobacterota bacterium]RLA67404.1 MAG: hypothetical protein DRQ88_02815 [Campylobacterota bacterium]